MSVSLSDHFTYKKIFKAVLPSIFMMIFTSVYSIVDGVFVSNFVGKTAFASVNLIMPVLMILGSIGFMLGTGGSALVAKKLGEGKREKANEIFSMIVFFAVIIGLFVSVLGFIFIEDIAVLLGATPDMLSDCVIYGRILIAVNFVFILQNVFQAMFVVAEKPVLGFLITVAAGVTNMILDATFVVGFKWGLKGAAIATALSYVIGGILPVFYFLSKKNKSLLKLVKTKLNFRHIGFSCLNGSSEMVSNISSSIVSMLFNMQLMEIAGENGVAAYGVIMYAGFIFAAIFIGYSIGTSPIVGYHYGAGNKSELKNLLKKSLLIILIFGAVMTALTELLAGPLSSIFVSYDSELMDLTTRGMRLYGFSFLVFGLNIFASSFFTSLNNGVISALISFLRTLVLQTIAILVMPMWLGIDGVWLSVVAAEILSLVVSVTCLVKEKKRYGY